MVGWKWLLVDCSRMTGGKEEEGEEEEEVRRKRGRRRRACVRQAARSEMREEQAEGEGGVVMAGLLQFSFPPLPQPLEHCYKFSFKSNDPALM